MLPLVIPGLPDGSNGDFGAPLSSCFWEWKPKLNVHYEKAVCENLGSPNVLFQQALLRCLVRFMQIIQHSRIVETTRHPAAAASFASIMFAPQAELSFNEAVSRCKANNVPICLMYGKEDPWVKPIWGLQVKRHVPEAPYYQISPAGHCPHDEIPEVINFLLRGWIRNQESKGSISLPLLDDLESMKLSNARELRIYQTRFKKISYGKIFGVKILTIRQHKILHQFSVQDQEFGS